MEAVGKTGPTRRPHVGVSVLVDDRYARDLVISADIVL